MNTETFSILAGQIMPIVIEAINQHIPKTKARYIVSLLVSIIVGYLTSYYGGSLNTSDSLEAIGLVFISSQTAYQMWFKGSSVEQKLQK